METLTRAFEFDAAHRVMGEKVKCFNLHGHHFNVEVTFEYQSKGSLGYAIDFKDIKRIVGTWIDEKLDHACIVNPQDEQIIDLCRKNNWRLYIMGMGLYNDVNPSAENLASELLFTLERIFMTDKNVHISKIRLYETPNCWVDTTYADYSGSQEFIDSIYQWAHDKSV